MLGPLPSKTTTVRCCMTEQEKAIRDIVASEIADARKRESKARDDKRKEKKRKEKRLDWYGRLTHVLAYVIIFGLLVVLFCAGGYS